MRAALLALALSAPAGAAEPRIEFSSFTLRNGLRVLVSRDASVPVAATAFIVDAGGRHEVPGRSGFAHFFEHMMFEGSAHAPEGTFDRLLESVGGDNNAETHHDLTLYYEVLPSNALPIAFWLDADRLASLDVSSAAVANQIEVVKEEKRMRVDNQPYGPLQHVEMASHTFSNWRNAHPTIGSFEDLDAASLSDVRAFFRAYYSPRNIVMAVVGDADPEEVRRQAEDWFGGIPAKAPPRRGDASEPPPSGEKTIELTDPHAKLPALAATWRLSVPRSSRDAYALVLLGRLLFSGKSARLYQALVKGAEAAVSVDGGLGMPLADWETYKEPGAFGAFVIHKRDVPFEGVRKAVRAELESLAARGPSAEELDRVKVRFRADWHRAQEDRLGRARRLLYSALLDGDPEEANRRLGRFMAVTPEDVRRAAALLEPAAATWFKAAPGGGS